MNGKIDTVNNSFSARTKFVALTKEKALVSGAKYALLVDFKTGGLHRLNAPAYQMLKLCQEGFSVEETLARMDLEQGSVDQLLSNLLEKKLITMENRPQPVIKESMGKTNPELKFLWLEITSRCNLRCIHCYAEASAQPAIQPDQKLIFDWLEQAADMGCQSVQFTGGECTLRKDLRNLILHARQNNFKMIEVFTNGTLLAESLIRFLKENDIHVAVSLYSYKSGTHDIISGVPGSHEKTMQNLKMLLAYDVPTRGSIIAMKHNEQEVEATRLFLNELGIISGPADPIRPCGRGTGMKDWPEKYGLSIIRSKPDFIANRKQFESNQSGNSCWFGNAAITSEGNVLPCVFPRDLVAGNLHEHSLRWIVDNGLRTFWELTRDKIAVCRDCEYRYLCHDCRPWAHGFTGDLYAKTPTCTYNPYTGEWAPADTALKV